MPLISIIIPCHNREHLLPYTLRSAKEAVKGLDAEIIVVDDQSTDRSVAVARRVLPSARIIALDENRGAPFCRNTGLKEAQGKYVLLLDSDDLLEPGFFAPKLDCFRQFPESVGVYGPWEHFSASGDFDEATVIPRHADYPLETKPNAAIQMERLLGGWFIPLHAILWRKDFLLQLGGQDEQLKINQDVDLLYRALLSSGSIVGRSSGRALIRDHGGERVGKINGNPDKLRQILALREKYVQELKQKGWWSESLAQAAGRYAFGYWVSYHRQFPEMAEEFYQFAHSLYPDINVRGGRLYEFSGKVVGPKVAVRLKSLLQTGKL